jgi:hypothetical protein
MTTTTTITTETATTTGSALSLAGHHYPEGAARAAAETYAHWRLRLREAGSRQEAAERAQSLSGAASLMAAALTGHPQAAGDTHADPLAWTDIATYTGGLATALRGDYVDNDRAIDDYDGPYHAWTDLANALNRLEFAAAWYTIAQDLRDRAGLNGDSDDGDGNEGRKRRKHHEPLRAFTAAQVIEAAAAVIDAPW